MAAKEQKGEVAFLEFHSWQATELEIWIQGVGYHSVDLALCFPPQQCFPDGKEEDMILNAFSVPAS